jgi:hypothetical protein
MTKEEIAHVVKKSKCKMLEGFDVEGSTREQIIKHLEKSCCPVLKKLLATK